MNRSTLGCLTFLAVLVFHGDRSLAQEKLWEPLHGPNGGYIFTVSVDSTQRIVIGTGAAGIFTSTNKGDIWKPLNKGLRTLRIKRIENGPEGYIYMNDLNNELARFHDIDVGWEFIVPWEDTLVPSIVNDLLIDPRGTVFVVGHKRGIRRSTDHGTSWQWSPWFESDSTRKKIAFRRIAETVSGDTLYVLDDSGYVYRSIDEGDSWTKADTTHPHPKVLAESMEISRGGDIIIASQRDIPGGKFYRSTNGGNSWSLVYEFPSPLDHVAYSLVRSNANGDLYASTHSPPDSKEQTHIGGIYYSTDNGVKWVLRDESEHGDDKFSMAVNGEGTIFHGSVPGGVEMSSDRGFTWVKKNDGLYAQFLLGAAVNSKSDLFTITPFTMYRSTTGGVQWQELNTEQIESTLEPIIRITAGDIIYHGTFYGLYRSSDNGDHWTRVIEGDPTDPNNNFYDLQRSPNEWIYTSSIKSGLMVSKDDGLSWSKVPNLPAGLKVTAFSFSGPDTVLVLTEVTDCYISTNGGINWMQQDGRVAGAKLLVHHSNGTFVALASHKVWSSTDNGDSWQTIFPPPGLDTIKNWDLYSMLLDRREQILVGSDTGIWRAKAPFTQWEQIGFGMTPVDYRLDHYAIASQIVQHPGTGILYASTRGESMFKSINPDAGVELSAYVSLPRGQNFPNPFSGQTSIELSVTEGGRAELEVYTALGDQLLHERKGNIEPGVHSFMFDGSQLAAGNYLYLLRIDGKPVARGWMQIVR